MACHVGPLGCSPWCSPAVQCDENHSTSSMCSTSRGSVCWGKSHWFCALQVAFAVNVCHRARSLYALTTGIVQFFIRDKGFAPFLVSYTHVNSLTLTSHLDLLFLHFQTACKTFLVIRSHQDLPWAQESPYTFTQKAALPFSVCASCSLQQPLQTQPLPTLEKKLRSGQSLGVSQRSAVPATGALLAHS